MLRAKNLSVQQLTKIISAPRFVNSAQNAWDISCATSHEAGFVVGHSFKTGTLQYGKVIAAHDNPKAPFNSYRDSIQGLVTLSLGDGYEQEYIPLIAFHTHPDARVTPSSSDFSTLIGFRRLAWLHYKLDHYPIGMTGTNAPYSLGKKFDILVCQERTSKQPREGFQGEMMSDWLDQTLPRPDCDDHVLITEVLNRSPFFRAALLRYARDTLTGQLTPCFSARQLTCALTSFAHQIKPVKGEPTQPPRK